MTHAIIDTARHGRAPLDQVQIFGERRSGTNFLMALTEANLRLKLTTRYGWKHGFPTMPCLRDEALFLVILRDPVSWLGSLHNRPLTTSHRGLEFSEFLRKTWRDEYDPKGFGHAKWGYHGMPRARGVATQADRHPITGKCFANPIELRTVKAQAMLGYLERECNVAIVDYDRLRVSPLETMAAIAERFGVELVKSPSVPGPVGPRPRRKPRIDMDTLAPEDRQFMLDQLDHELEARMGYGATMEALGQAQDAA